MSTAATAYVCIGIACTVWALIRKWANRRRVRFDYLDVCACLGCVALWPLVVAVELHAKWSNR